MGGSNRVSRTTLLIPVRDDCETARTQAVAEAIHDERAGCLQIAESVRDPTGDAIAAAIRLRRRSHIIAPSRRTQSPGECSRRMAQLEGVIRRARKGREVLISLH
jgi:hypothetical protein